VFGARAVEAVLMGKEAPTATGALRPVLTPGAPIADGVAVQSLGTTRPRPRPVGGQMVDATKETECLQRAMSIGAGVVRSAESLEAAGAQLAALSPPPGELANLVAVAEAIVAGATAREESRGGHRRSDFPAMREAFSHRFVQ
jgi:aspartate oxidase